MNPTRSFAVVSPICAALGFQSRALACSCVLHPGTEQQQVQQAVDSADAVLVAKIRRVSQSIDYEHPERPVTVEEIRFVILEVLKGSDDYRIGQPVLTRSRVAAGACGLSARNEPSWITELHGETEVPIAISDTWLIYAHGDEPFELFLRSRLLPLNLSDAQWDLGLLRQLLDKDPPRSPRWEATAVQPILGPPPAIPPDNQR